MSLPTTRWIHIALVAAALAMAPAASALAQPVFADAESDWAGFYAGVLGTARVSGGDVIYGVTGVAGISYELGDVVLGAEADLLVLNGGSGAVVEGQVLGRAGFEVTDGVLVFAAGGLGTDVSGSPGAYALFGGGVDIAFSDTLSFRGQYLYGEGLGAADDQQQVSFGALFSF